MQKILLQVDELDDLMVKHTAPPATSVLRNKLAFIRQQLEAEAKARFDEGQLMTQLKAQNHELITTVQALEAKDSALAAFEEQGGVLWKRTAGGFEASPYCNRCADHPVLIAFPPGRPLYWICSICQLHAPHSRPTGP